MLRSTKRYIRLRKEFLASQPHDFPVRDEQSYLFWFDQSGEPMSMDRWNDPQHRVMQLLLGSDDGTLAGLVVVNGSTPTCRSPCRRSPTTTARPTGCSS